MSLLRRLAESFLRHSRSGARRREPAARPRPVRPTLTLLEDRLAPAVLTVNSLADAVSAAGPTLTLPEAIALIDSGGTATDAAGASLAAAKAGQIDAAQPFGDGDVIRFAPNLFGPNQQQITLADGELSLDRSVSILGPGAGRLAVSGDNQSPVFEVAAGASVSISGLTITGGASDQAGGGVVNNGTLTLTDSTVSGNAAALGGGVANYGTMTLNDSTVADNTASDCAGIERLRRT